MDKYIIVEINGKKVPLRWVSGILISGKYICGADDLFDLGFTPEEIKNNDIILHVDDLKIEIKK